MPRACLMTKLAFCSVLLGNVLAAQAQEQIALWPGPAPVGDGSTESAASRITVHRPAADKANGAAMVICPGGGYGGLVVGAEGHGIAAWLMRHGITGVVLEYRLPKGRRMVPLLDAQRGFVPFAITRATGNSIQKRSASLASRPVDTWPRPPVLTSTPAIHPQPTRSTRSVADPTSWSWSTRS